MIILLHCRGPVILLCALFYLGHVLALKLIELRVPMHVPLGIRAHMFCSWELGPHDVLYTVKWYKDGMEFFRYVPKDPDPFKKFLLPGVDVEEFNSSGSNISLAPAVLATSGRYRCEVSGERPQFRTVSEYADIIVIVLPSQGLRISGFATQYKVGDHVNASCSSAQSKPVVNLTWYINGEPATTYVARALYDNNETILIIEFIIDESFVGYFKLQCLATIGSSYWQSVEKISTVSRTRENTILLKYTSLLTHPANVTSGFDNIKRHHFLLVSSSIFVSSLIIYGGFSLYE